MLFKGACLEFSVNNTHVIGLLLRFCCYFSFSWMKGREALFEFQTPDPALDWMSDGGPRVWLLVT